MLPLHLREYKRLLLSHLQSIRYTQKLPINRGRITQVALRILRNGVHAMKNPFEYVGIAYDMA